MNEITLRRDVAYYDGMFAHNYNERIDKEVTAILKLVDEEGVAPSHEIRNEIIETVFDAFIAQTKKVPSGVQVQRLANWLLLEEMTNNHPDKVSNTEFPFMTKRQLRTRYRREMANESIPETLTTQPYLEGRKSPTYNPYE